MLPQFSERDFEFCFNSTFIRAQPQATFATPYIPSQRLEGIYGYDVEFRLTKGSFSRSVFIQHKVSHFATKRAGRNARFYDAHDGPYFRFLVHKEHTSRQHNLLRDLALRGEEVYYCAPVFYSLDDLRANYASDQVLKNSTRLPVLDFDAITDDEQHHITYDLTHPRAVLHSPLSVTDRVLTWDTLLESQGQPSPEPAAQRQGQPSLLPEHISQEQGRPALGPGYLSNLLERIRDIISRSSPRDYPSRPSDESQVVEISRLLRQHFDARWLLLP